jgi:hypothetical protein
MTKGSDCQPSARDASTIGLLRLAAGCGQTNRFEAWREGFLLDSTRSAFSIARESGINESLRMLGLDLYLAVRLTNGGCSFAI